MKKKLRLEKKSLKNLKLTLKKISNKKIAPLLLIEKNPTNTSSC